MGAWSYDSGMGERSQRRGSPAEMDALSDSYSYSYSYPFSFRYPSSSPMDWD